MIKILIDYYDKSSLLGNFWKIKRYDERQSLMISQKHQISPILSKLLTIRNIKDEDVDNFLNPIFEDNFPNPFVLKDMEKSVNRTIHAIKKNQKIGIIADYDVDGSTSSALLYNFLSFFNCNISLKIPDRLNEGYGPNLRIMNEFLTEKVDLVFSLDCGTSSFGILDHNDYKNIDIIIIDHHISENILPKIHSIINPNRFDENNSFQELAAVGVTFLFVIGVRKKLRDSSFFKKTKNEPNLLKSLDLVALGTICDVVNLKNYNRKFVKKGLEIIRKRSNKAITKIIDNSNFNHSPTSRDVGFIIGPQLNSASRINDSSLSSKLLITNNLVEIEFISKKLLLLNEKRKLIENKVFEEALNLSLNQKNNKFILVYNSGWHKGVLGIVASRLVEKYNKPTIVISTNNNIGIGSARSIKQINLGNIIINAKNEGLIISGGGHKMAAGLKIKNDLIDNFKEYLNKNFLPFKDSIFYKIDSYDLKVSLNEINIDFLKAVEKLEPYGNGNPEPKFIIYDVKIESYKILKEKHILIFLRSSFFKNIKAICFNSINTKLGENLIKNKSAKFELGCTISRDNFNNNLEPQIIIKDAMINN